MKQTFWINQIHFSMKKIPLLLIALCLIGHVCSAQEQDYARQWHLGYGPKTLCGIPSGHTNPAGNVAYDYGEMVFDASLWNPLSRISIGPQLSLFGTYLIPHPDDPGGSLLKFGLGVCLGVGRTDSPPAESREFRATMGSDVEYVPLSAIHQVHPD